MSRINTMSRFNEEEDKEKPVHQCNNCDSDIFEYEDYYDSVGDTYCCIDCPLEGLEIIKKKAERKNSNE